MADETPTSNRITIRLSNEIAEMLTDLQEELALGSKSDLIRLLIESIHEKLKNK